MLGNPYMNRFNPQTAIDRINSQIAELEKMKTSITQTPIQQPANLTQNFQIAPTNNNSIRYVNSIDEVQKDYVVTDTPYFSKDLSVLWIKNNKNEIKTYELNEIVQKDEKDLQIEFLMAQVEELKGMIKDEQHTTNVDEPKVSTNTSTVNDTDGKSVKESKSSSISRVSKSKTK